LYFYDELYFRETEITEFTLDCGLLSTSYFIDSDDLKVTEEF